MGIIQDQRPRDWAYKAVFKEKDLPSLEEMARHIRETHDTDMIEDFNAKCEQKLTGKTAVLDNGIEIEAVTKSEDLVTNAGLDKCIQFIIGTSTARWSHFGMSAGNTPAPAVTDTALQVETIVNRAVLAWNEPVGMRLYFGGISGQTDISEAGGTAPTAVGEIGVYNGSAAGATLLNRTLWATDTSYILTQQTPSISNIRSAPIVVSCVIEFCPVV